MVSSKGDLLVAIRTQLLLFIWPHVGVEDGGCIERVGRIVEAESLFAAVGRLVKKEVHCSTRVRLTRLWDAVPDAPIFTSLDSSVSSSSAALSLARADFVARSAASMWGISVASFCQARDSFDSGRSKSTLCAQIIY